MRTLFKFIFVGNVFIFSGFTSSLQVQDEAELICVKNQKSTNTCFYNFKIGGIPYHFRDMGCKRKKEDIVKDVNAGDLALSKDWKIPCPEEKKKEDAKTDF